MAEIHPSHIKRYEFARAYVSGKRVLDVGCADGFGTNVLSVVAEKINAIDNDPTLITKAKENFVLPNADFQTGDARKLSFPDDFFDVVVAFEVIEHFIDQQSFMSEARRVLKKDGIIILSTPDHDANRKIGVYQPNHEGHGHPAELTFPQFFYLVNQYFDTPKFYGQFFYQEPSFKDRMKNVIKRLDVVGARKLIPQSTRNRHNPSVFVYQQDFEIRKLDHPAVQMIVVAVNKK